MKRILVLALVASLALGVASFAQDTSALADSANPDSAQGLLHLAYNERAAQKWADAKQHAERGLQALARMPKADGVSDADFAKWKAQSSALLNSIAGFSALQLKDYAAAQQYLRPAVEADPNNVENVYPLALAYLTATPPDDVNGLFFIARAANLVSDPRGRDSIIKFGRGRYQKYHGSDQGWDDLLATTKTTLLPPPGSPSSGNFADSANPDTANDLALLASNERAAQNWADAKQHAERGLQALTKMAKPDGVSDADFANQQAQLSGLLNSVAGFSALQLKDYASAQKYLRPAVEADPNNVENVYPLALSYLTATPSDDVNGLFFIARAANLVADPGGKASIIKFGHSRYVKYHGSEQGWDDLLAMTKTTLLPSPGPPSGDQESSPVELKEGQTPQEVEKLLGKPSDTITLKGSLVYVYPTVKVIFEDGKLVDVQYKK